MSKVKVSNELLHPRAITHFLKLSPTALRDSRRHDRGHLCGYPAPKYIKINPRIIRYPYKDFRQWLIKYLDMDPGTQVPDELKFAPIKKGKREKTADAETEK